MSAAVAQPIMDYYRLYGIDRAWKAKDIVKAIRKEQADARAHMAALPAGDEETFKKVQKMFNEASEAIKRFKTEEKKREYDQLLDEAYRTGQIDMEAQKRAEGLIEEIEAMFVKGNYQAVVKACDDALNRKMYDEKLFSYKARSCSFIGEQSNAFKSIDDGLEMYPSSIDILSTGARLYNVSKNDFDMAQKMINRMFEVEDDNKWANIEQIYLYLMFDKEDLAYKDIDGYLNRHPQDSEFRRACAHDLVSYTMKFHVQDPDTGVYLLISEESYNKCVEIAEKAIGIYEDDITREALNNIRAFGEIEFNEDNKENIGWSAFAAFLYLAMGVISIAVVRESFVVALLPIALGALLCYCTYQLYQVSKRPYWQISKYYLTGKREKKEKKYILIGKILSFYMRWSIKAAVWIVKFAFRLALR